MTVQTQRDSQSRPRPHRLHWGLRAGAVSAGVMLASSAASAVAAPPQGWENAVNDGMLVSLIKLVGIPLLVVAVVTLLTYLPSMVRGGSGTSGPDTYFSGHSEWFGGPRESSTAVEAPASSGDKQALGGAGARW